MTPEEYVALEDVTPYRNEYYDGAMIAMVDRTHANAKINGNILYLFHQQLRDSPWVFMGSNMRVLIETLTIYTYPDGSVSPELVQTVGDSETTMIDPHLVVEVLPPSGKSYLRRAGFQHFQQIAALQHYLVISQERMHVGHYTRMPNAPSVQWLYTAYLGEDAVLRLPSLNARLPLREIYKGVKFPEAGSTPSQKHPNHDRIF